MKLKEVRDTYFSFEDKKISLIKEVQAHFIKHKLSPYVWIDNNCHLHVKIKHRRGLSYPQLSNLNEIYNLSEEVADFIDSKIVWSETVESFDELLKEENKVLCTTEFVYKVRGE